MEKKVIVIIVAISIVVLLILGIGTAVVGPSKIINMITGDDDGDGDGKNTTNGGGGGGGNQNPVARIVVKDDTMNLSSTKEFAANERIWFDASTSTPIGNISYYEWDFGDGLTSQGAGEKYSLVNHSYNSKGKYIVNLTVVASNQARGKTNVTITILGEPYLDSTSEILSTRVGSSNATVTFPVDIDARNMTLSFTVNGLSQELSARLNIEIFNPFHELMDNTTMTVVISGSHDFYFSPPQIAPVGNYFIEMSCQAGTVRVLVDIEVQY